MPTIVDAAQPCPQSRGTRARLNLSPVDKQLFATSIVDPSERRCRQGTVAR